MANKEEESMKTYIKPVRYKKTMFMTLFPLVVGDEVYDKYFTYNRFTVQYFICILFGHRNCYASPSVEKGGVYSSYYAKCCDRRYYPEAYEAES